MDQGERAKTTVRRTARSPSPRSYDHFSKSKVQVVRNVQVASFKIRCKQEN